MAANGHRASSAEVLVVHEGAYEQRMKSAAVRAQSDQARLRNNIDRMCAEMDDTTPGPPRQVEFTEEDSLVTSITALLESRRDDDR